MSTKKEMQAAFIVSDPRWASVSSRDTSADSSFVYSVKTTGVYCRPSCASRAARPENIAFHANGAAAERAGFRACKRCKPEQASLAQRNTATITELCRYIDSVEHMPTLDELAHRAGLSAYHLHRMFKAAMGLTPRTYAASRRAERVREQLAKDVSVTTAIYDAGYNSQGRFYDEAASVLGMTPTAYRRGGADMKIRYAIAQSSLGAILVAQSERGVCAIKIGDDPKLLTRELLARYPRAEMIGGDVEFETLVTQVVELVEAPGLGHDLPLDIRGTAFQQRVWQALREIPVGTTASYSELARTIGAPKAVRAVASACAANDLAVLIPCHRVVRSDGELSGYRWGVERKRALLDREDKV